MHISDCMHYFVYGGSKMEEKFDFSKIDISKMPEKDRNWLMIFLLLFIGNCETETLKVIAEQLKPGDNKEENDKE